MIITASQLFYQYRTFKKSEGRFSSVKDFFSRHYILKEALSDLSLEVGEGKIVGLLGPNGAGKTTLIKILTGLIQPTNGDVKVLGYTPHLKEADFYRQIGVVLGQKSGLLWDLPPLDTFEMLRVIYRIDRSSYQSRLTRFLKLLHVEHVIHTPARALSLGERMKCELIAALLHHPKVLFLDEPTIGLDFQSQTAIRGFLRQITEKDNVTIILTSHHLMDIEKLCDELLIIQSGKICYRGDIQSLIARCDEKATVNFSCDQFSQFDGYTFDKLTLNQYSVQCEKGELSALLHLLTSKNKLLDVDIKKSTLEEAIYHVLDIG